MTTLLMPSPYEVYQHYKGGVYVVLANAVIEATGEHVVVYRSAFCTKPTVWVCPLSEWWQEVEGGARRFTQLYAGGPELAWKETDQQ